MTAGNQQASAIHIPTIVPTSQQSIGRYDEAGREDLEE